MAQKVKYCVGLNCRPNNIETILEKRARDIYEIYAAAPLNICATGRRGNIPISEKELRAHAALAHRYGVRYNVLMNGACFGGMEFSDTFRKKIAAFIKYLDEISVDSVTIENPFLIDLTRKNSTHIEIIVSSYAEVVEPVKIRRLEARGVNRIVLHQNVYRNFEMLKAIRQSTNLPLEIIPNQGCIYQCECFMNHINIVAHSSTASDEEIKEFGDYNFPIKKCRTLRQTNPVEFLMACFIRPEDLCIYEDMGFNIFKFAGRRSSTEWMLNVLDAYIGRNYEGNLFDLSSHVGENPKLCKLPNKALDSWFRYMGSNADSERFYKRAHEFCQQYHIDQYFPRLTV